MAVRPSSHANEFAKYAQVRPDPTQAPTGLVLVPGQTGKGFVDDFGTFIEPRATITYPLAATDQRDNEFVVQTEVGGIRNTVTISDRILGPSVWMTYFPEFDFGLSWLLWGDESGTGATLQLDEVMVERYGDDDQFLHNPTQCGAGQTFETPGADPYRSIRCYGSEPLYFRIDADGWETACYPLEFGGAGLDGGPSQDHGQDETHPVVWFGQRIQQSGKLNAGGSAVAHRIVQWSYVPTAFGAVDDDAPVICHRHLLDCLLIDFFDEAYRVDLATGVPVALTNFVAAPATTVVRDWTWSRHFFIYHQQLPTDEPLETLAYQASPYQAGIVRNAGTDFCIAFAFKLGDTASDRNQYLADRIGSLTHASIGVHAGSGRTGSLHETWSVILSLFDKTDGSRPQGWVSLQYWTCQGSLAQVTAALQELYTSGAMDAAPPDPAPTVTAGTIWPPRSAIPTPLRTSRVVLLWGDSTACTGDPTVLKLDRNAELAKYPKSNPITAEKPVRTTEAKKLIWNSALQRWEMLQHDRNAGGWAQSVPGTCGPETSWLDRLVEREGLDEVFVIKVASPGSALSAAGNPEVGWSAAEADVQILDEVAATIAPVTGGATITAAPGTFSGVTAPTGIEIAGSQVTVGSWSGPNYLAQTGVQFPGTQDRTGNNTWRGRPLRVTAVNGDGSQITVDDESGVSFGFASESGTFTFRVGRLPLRDLAAADVAAALDEMRRNYRRDPVLLATASMEGSNDMGLTSAQFRDLVVEQVAWARGLFDEVESSSPQCPPHLLVLMSPNTVFGTDSEVEAIRAGQVAAAALINNCATIETLDLPMRLEATGETDAPWPPLERKDNGGHFTTWALMEIGWRLDLALDAFAFVPAHPDASLEINPGGRSYYGLTSTAPPTDPPTDPVARVASVTSPAEIIAAIDEAILAGAEVASYSVNGRIVTLRGLDELVRVRKYYEGLLVRGNGVRRTVVSF